MKTEKNFKQEKMLKFTQFVSFERGLVKTSVFKKLQLRYSKLEIFLTCSSGFEVFEAHLLMKLFLIKKGIPSF